MSTIDRRSDYLKNPYFTGHIYSDFSPFYIAVGICTVLFVALLLLNTVCCLCSKHRGYWKNKHTGNRWLIPIWISTAHKQPPLDLTELQYANELKPFQHSVEIERQREKEERTPLPLPQQRPQRPQSTRALLQQHRQQHEEYVEFKKRESDI